MIKNMRHLSKSQFTRGLQCAKSLYLYREAPELQDPLTAEQKAIFDQGTEVGELARKWIKGGMLVDTPSTEPEMAAAQTRDYMAMDIPVIYEAAFIYDNILVRTDIIARNPEGNWDLFEVKSTTEVKDVFLLDVAIQRHVMRGAGMIVNAAHLVHLDSAYVRQGDLDLQKLFKAIDVTTATEGLLDMVPQKLRQMQDVIESPEAPERAIGPHCTKPYDCSFIGHCWKDVPDYSVFNLAGARMDKKTALWNSGVKTIDAITPYDPKTKKGEKLTPYQSVQHLVAQTQKPFIHTKGISDLLRDLGYPRYFLDFEAVNPAIPPYDGLRPYQQLPFEASIHVRHEPGAPLDHHEYLADGTRDPRYELASFLRACLGSTGPIIAYNKSYEGGIIKALAGSSEFTSLLQAEARLWDLADFFRKGLWADPAFKGSWSIKRILPVLVPDMTYEGMAIADGVAAMQAYAKIMDPEITADERAAIMADLRAYCSTDTLAMVRILDKVEETVGVAA